MKIWPKVPILFGVAGWVLSNAWGGPAPPTASTAIQAIQQGSDPSAVVAAFANGVAVDGNDPKLYEAYVSRMVDLGLPELAYHQAQTLTTLQSNNGLAWGVVAYVNARRGDMPEAISAINLAGQAAPQNVFVQRTAGEIVAWYDLQADKSKLPDNEKDGLIKVRTLLEKEPAFTAAFDTAKDAYRAQANAPQSFGEAAPSQYQSGSDQYGVASQSQPQGNLVAPLDYAEAPSGASYYPDYYYDWGPNWVQPAPWWWWQPVGFFGGCNFFPFSSFVVFNNAFFFVHHHFFHHDKFFHNRGLKQGHDGSFHHDGLKVGFRDSNHAFFQRDGQSAFFGTATRPNRSLTASARANFSPAGFAGSSLGLRNGMSGLMARSALRSSMPSMNMPRANRFASRGTVTRQGTFSASRGTLRFASSMPMRSGVMPRSAFRMPAFRGGVPARGLRQPAFAAPHMAPRSMPMRSGFAAGGFRGAGGPHGGFHGGGGFRGGGRR